MQVESRSQTGHLVHRTDWLADEAFLPRGEVTYHLGLLALAEALAGPAAYPDLLDALAEVLVYRRDRGADLSPSEPDFLRLMGHLSDELYFALRYGPEAPEPDFDRLAAPGDHRRRPGAPGHRRPEPGGRAPSPTSAALRTCAASIRQPEPSPPVSGRGRGDLPRLAAAGAGGDPGPGDERHPDRPDGHRQVAGGLRGQGPAQGTGSPSSSSRATSR